MTNNQDAYGNVYVTREDFEAWLDLFGAKHYHRNHSSGSIQVEEGDLTYIINFTEIIKIGREMFYAYGAAYQTKDGLPTHYRISNGSDSHNIKGKGSRSEEAWKRVREIKQVLIDCAVAL